MLLNQYQIDLTTYQASILSSSKYLSIRDGPVVIAVALLFCTQRVRVRLPVGPPPMRTPKKKSKAQLAREAKRARNKAWKELSAKEKARLSAVCDRLIVDATRRRQGAFFTPTPWVNEAHRRITDFLGADWRDEYVVVDTSCGTKNLERDYHFKELYLSTLEPSELEISKQYCPEAKATAALDFLNSTDEEMFAALPGLEDALKVDRKVVWLMNPPYGTGNVAGSSGQGKAGIAKNVVNEMMKAAKMGGASQQLFAQFLYRIIQLKKKYNATNFTLAFFCKPIFLSGSAYKKFRKLFLKEFKFEDGMLFNAGHFADTSANWGINFSIWSSGETADRNVFRHDLMDVNDDGDVIKVGEKIIYNVGNMQNLSAWAKEPIKSIPTKEEINLISAIKVREGDAPVYGKIFDKALGYMQFVGDNNVGLAYHLSMFSAAFGSGHGFGINENNFARCCAAFTARCLIGEAGWENATDEFMAPDETNPAYRNFEADSLVYSLFESKSQQSSLRGVSYKNKSWDVLNHFFFVPSKDMAEWADEAGLDATYAEANAAPDRYMVKALAEAEPFMSDEAKVVLAEARRLVRASMKYRELFDDEHPAYQVRTFDAGWYQVKAVLKEYMPEELKKFRELTKKLADRMRPAVYELNFLRK